MKNSYFFRSKYATRRYFASMLASQVGGVVLFVGTAMALAATGTPFPTAILSAIMGSSVFVIGTGYIAHRRDLKLLREKSWPQDTVSDAKRTFANLLKKSHHNVGELTTLSKKVEDNLFKNGELRKRAYAVGASKTIPSIIDNQKNIIETRRRVKQILGEATVTRGELVEILNQLEVRYEPTHDQSLVRFQVRVDSQTKTLKLIRQGEIVVERELKQLNRQIGTAST